MHPTENTEKRIRPEIHLDAALEILELFTPIATTKQPAHHRHHKAQLQLALFLERALDCPATILKPHAAASHTSKKLPPAKLDLTMLNQRWLEYKESHGCSEEALTSPDAAVAIRTHYKLIAALKHDQEIFVANDKEHSHQLPPASALSAATAPQLHAFVEGVRHLQQTGIPLGAKDKAMLAFVSENITPLMTPKTPPSPPSGGLFANTAPPKGRT